jgi:hypothetical protein
MHLERLGDNQPAIVADTSCVLNELDLQFLINYCIALKEVLQGHVSPLGFCNLLGYWRVYFILVTAICKHFIHEKAVGLHCPSLRAQFLWFHTKHCMGVLIGFVELGIIF